MKEIYSNFKYFQAFAPEVTSSAAGAQNGITIDLQGYEAVTIAVGICSYASGGANGAGDYVMFALQHGLASAAGVSAWSLVGNSQLIHSVVGGYDSTASTGIFLSLASASEVAASANSDIYFVGYKKDTTHRYLRLKYSNVGAASAMYMNAVAFLGCPANWPVNESV